MDDRPLQELKSTPAGQDSGSGENRPPLDVRSQAVSISKRLSRTQKAAPEKPSPETERRRRKRFVMQAALAVATVVAGVGFTLIVIHSTNQVQTTRADAEAVKSFVIASAQTMSSLPVAVPHAPPPPLPEKPKPGGTTAGGIQAAADKRPHPGQRTGPGTENPNLPPGLWVESGASGVIMWKRTHDSKHAH